MPWQIEEQTVRAPNHGAFQIPPEADHCCGEAHEEAGTKD